MGSVTDLLINAAAPPNVSPLSRFNTYTQSWNPASRGPRASHLNHDIARMISTAKKYDTNLAALQITPNISVQLPAWYHANAQPRPLNNIPSKCLLKNHNIKTVADLVRASARVQPGYNGSHIPTLTCTCIECAKDRLMNCRYPHQCAQEALTHIRDIAPKFNPLLGTSQRDLHWLTPTRNTWKEIAMENPTKTLFDPTISCKMDLSDCFRTFTNLGGSSPTLVRRRHVPGFNLPDQSITVYTDRACFNNGKENVQCGSGIWVAPDSQFNTSLKVPGPKHSNHVGEIAAIIKVALLILPCWPLTIKTDSRYAINSLTIHLKEWEDKGWLGIKNAKFFKRAAYLLRRRTAPTFLEWVKGHDRDLGNEESDKLAKEGATKDIPDDLPLEIPPEYDLQGAKLATMTQALAHKGIRTKKPPPSQPTTIANLCLLKTTIQNLTTSHESNAAIWMGLRRKSIRPRVQQFLYKTIHGAYRIGRYRSFILGYESRGQCSRCHTIEDMAHILTTCTAEPVRIIWNLARETWPHTLEFWPDINLGLVLAGGTLTLPEDPETEQNDENNENKAQRRSAKQGMNRLLQILISESAHLICVLRCDHIINEHSHTPEEIKLRWLRAINARLIDDKIIATKIHRGQISLKLVENIWVKDLQKDHPIHIMDSHSLCH